jgi:hypothetical protein
MAYPLCERIPEALRQQIVSLPRDEKSGLLSCPISGQPDLCCPLSAFLRLADPDGYGLKADMLCSRWLVADYVCSTPIDRRVDLGNSEPDECVVAVYDEAYDFTSAFDRDPAHFDLHAAFGIEERTA